MIENRFDKIDKGNPVNTTHLPPKEIWVNILKFVTPLSSLTSINTTCKLFHATIDQILDASLSLKKHQKKFKLIFTTSIPPQFKSNSQEIYNGKQLLKFKEQNSCVTKCYLFEDSEIWFQLKDENFNLNFFDIKKRVSYTVLTKNSYSDFLIRQNYLALFNSKYVHLYNRHDGVFLAELPLHEGDKIDVDEAHLYLGRSTGQISVYDLATKKLIETYEPQPRKDQDFCSIKYLELINYKNAIHLMVGTRDAQLFIMNTANLQDHLKFETEKFEDPKKDSMDGLTYYKSSFTVFTSVGDYYIGDEFNPSNFKKIRRDGF